MRAQQYYQRIEDVMSDPTDLEELERQVTADPDLSDSQRSSVLTRIGRYQGDLDRAAATDDGEEPGLPDDDDL
jgi:hypothetical protein